jgi:general secretion pathway protein D
MLVRDGDTAVIGGIYQRNSSLNYAKVPFLADIPILGFFFRNTVKTVQKTNILIALTPYVISDQSDLRRVLEKKLKERREFVERFGKQEVVDPEAVIDYRRKRGMLEEINRSAIEIEKEEAEMQEQIERDALDEESQLEPAVPRTQGGGGGGSTGPDAPGVSGPPAPSLLPPPSSAPPGPRAPVLGPPVAPKLKSTGASPGAAPSPTKP